MRLGGHKEGLHVDLVSQHKLLARHIRCFCLYITVQGGSSGSWATPDLSGTIMPPLQAGTTKANEVLLGFQHSSWPLRVYWPLA